MSKVGRNEPCTCGSGKKYKACCLGRSASSGLTSGLSREFEASRLQAEAFAARWLGSEHLEREPEAPLRDQHGGLLRLVMDRFTVSEPSAIAAVRALGRVEEEAVLIFDQERWLGEIDLSLAGVVTVISVGEQNADRLRALLTPIDGLAFEKRQVDRLEALSSQPGAASGMLDFKRTFFAAWPEEPNQKLGGMTPVEAAGSTQWRPQLLRLLSELETKESKLPKAERYSFAQLRDRLGV